MPHNVGEAFGVRLSFLALSHAVTMSRCAVESVHGVNTKAAERTAALHDAGARFANASQCWRSFWSAPVFSGAFPCGDNAPVRGRISPWCKNESGRTDSRTPRPWREVHKCLSILAKLLDCACLFWRS